MSVPLIKHPSFESYQSQHQKKVKITTCVCIKKNPIKRSILKCKLSEASTTMRTMWMPRQRQYFNLFFDTDAPSIPVNRRPSTMLPGNTKAIQLRTTQASLVIISVYHLSYMCYLWQGPSLA